MTDTTAPAPTWMTILQGFMPSLNQCLVIAVTASVTFISTLAMQRFATPHHLAIPAADKPAPVSLQRQFDLAANRVEGRFMEVLGAVGELKGVCELRVDELQALRKDHRTPARAASPAAKSLPPK